MKPIPLRTCPTCGGNWFRLTDYYEFLLEQFLPSRPTSAGLIGQISPGPIGLGVCLCGAPWTPELSREPGPLLLRFLNSYMRASEVNDISHRATAELADQKSFDALQNRLKVLQGAVGRRMRTGRGRPWNYPTRKPASTGRDGLVVALQERGFAFREARAVVDAICQSMRAGLQGDGSVETPLGVFEVVRRQPQQRQRFGRGQIVYRRPGIRFRAAQELRIACNTLSSKETPVVSTPTPVVPAVNVARGQRYCEICGSVVFYEAEFRQWVQMASAVPGGDASPTTSPIRALICLCGHPTLPGQLRRSVDADLRASFQDSFRAAVRWRESVRPAAVIQELATKDFVTKQEFAELAGKIVNLEAMVSQLTAGATRSESVSSRPSLEGQETGQANKESAEIE